PRRAPRPPDSPALGALPGPSIRVRARRNADEPDGGDGPGPDTHPRLAPRCELLPPLRPGRRARVSLAPVVTRPGPSIALSIAPNIVPQCERQPTRWTGRTEGTPSGGGGLFHSRCLAICLRLVGQVAGHGRMIG